jgi:exodeoxyribonuclease VII large subunit
MARTELASQQRRLGGALAHQLVRRRHALDALAAQLELLNPQRTLERGYAIVTDAHGKVLRSPAQITVREPLTVRLAEGSAEIGVASVQPALQ